MTHSAIYRVIVFLVAFLAGSFAGFKNPPDSVAVREAGPSGGTNVSALVPTKISSPTSESIPRQKICNDPEIKPIWKAIRRDREVREALDDEISPSDCREAFEIGYFDINGDGKKEIFARAIGIPFCGAVGNCDLFILQKTKKGLRLLLHAGDYVDRAAMGDQLLKSRTNGYLDIITLGHFSASETSHTTYKFNGRKYVEANCMYEVPKYDRDNKLMWEFISCKEFYRRLERDLKQSDQVVNLR
jgi:hypothetical protein